MSVLDIYARFNVLANYKSVASKSPSLLYTSNRVLARRHLYELQEVLRMVFLSRASIHHIKDITLYNVNAAICNLVCFIILPDRR
jgi:hypothetical protein